MTKANRRLLWEEGKRFSEVESGGQEDLNIQGIDAAHRARLVGRYQLTPNFIVDVKDRDGRLTVQATNQSALDLSPDSKTHWSNNAVNATLEFKLPNKGPAKSLILHQNGSKQTAKRMKD